jgi:hypothetical protein
MNYRKIYEQHYGKIPKDKDGRTYEVHHIDGDHSNNDPSNLKAVTIQEHYDIHYDQGDWAACLMISSRMEISPEEKAMIASRHQRELVENGTHPWLGPESNRIRIEDGTHHFLDPVFQREVARKSIEDGTHPFMTRPDGTNVQTDKIEDGIHHFLDSEWQKEKAKKAVENGTHNLLTRPDGTNVQTDRIANGTHHFIGENSPTQVKWKCPHCEVEGKGQSNYKRWHGDNCKHKNGRTD